MTNELMLVLIMLNLLSFGIGYIIAKLHPHHHHGVYHNESLANRSIANNKVLSKVTIDEKKYVVDIPTEGLEKKFDKIADEKKSDEKIVSSVNKLKNMKG